MYMLYIYYIYIYHWVILIPQKPPTSFGHLNVALRQDVKKPHPVPVIHGVFLGVQRMKRYRDYLWYASQVNWFNQS